MQRIVDGAMAHEDEGLAPTAIVLEATSIYFEQEDGSTALGVAEAALTTSKSASRSSHRKSGLVRLSRIQDRRSDISI